MAPSPSVRLPKCLVIEMWCSGCCWGYVGKAKAVFCRVVLVHYLFTCWVTFCLKASTACVWSAAWPRLSEELRYGYPLADDSWKGKNGVSGATVERGKLQQRERSAWQLWSPWVPLLPHAEAGEISRRLCRSFWRRERKGEREKGWSRAQNLPLLASAQCLFPRELRGRFLWVAPNHCGIWGCR